MSITTLVTSQIEEGKRRAVEARARLTPEQLAWVVAVEEGFPDMMRRAVITGEGKGGRVFMKIMTPEDFAEMFPDKVS